MRIVHILPADTYTEGMTYKDNFLAKINIEDGHEAIIITSCREWNKTEVTYTEPQDYINKDGVRVIRLEYKNILGKYLTSKMRILKGLEKLLQELRPDVIRVLNPHNLSILIVNKYVNKNKNIKFYIDSHQEFYNSAIGFFSYYIFHKMIIKRALRKVDKNVTKYFYVLEGTKNFLMKMYGLTENKLEYFPMGGIILTENEKKSNNLEIRKSLGIALDNIVYIHTGKLFKSKLTKEIIDAFNHVNDENSRLIIIGSIPEETAEELKPRLKSNRNIHYLGWKDSSLLYKYLNASDVYLQPGSASATLFQALTAGCVLAVSNKINGYEKLNKNSSLLYASSYNDLIELFSKIQSKKIDLIARKKETLEIAQDYNYSLLLKKIY